jgi:hypothetical protein
MGCGASKDVKKPSSPSDASQCTVPAESAGAALATAATEFAEDIEIIRSGSVGRPQGGGSSDLAALDALKEEESEKTQDTAQSVSRMDQDILLYMNQGAGENLRLSCLGLWGAGHLLRLAPHVHGSKQCLCPLVQYGMVSTRKRFFTASSILGILAQLNRRTCCRPRGSQCGSYHPRRLAQGSRVRSQGA